ncbi:MAG: recombinase family protein [Clostridia bacterium]
MAAYCRVSTDDEDQFNSYRTQKAYYTDYIKKNPKWRFTGIYADEGITGTLVKKRDDFLRMIADCEKGKIDLILIKSVSRYARNIVDCISYIRKLKALGIGIYFEEQNISLLRTARYISVSTALWHSRKVRILVLMLSGESISGCRTVHMPAALICLDTAEIRKLRKLGLYPRKQRL